MKENKSVKATQKAINKLISEEWCANELYRSMISACDTKEKEVITKMFTDSADDEYYDHFTKLVKFAEMNEFEVPVKISEYEKHAEDLFKRINKLKKGEKADYYISEAHTSEEMAMASYSVILNDEDVLPEFKGVILEMYYDEIEHMNNLRTLLMAYRVGAHLNY